METLCEEDNNVHRLLPGLHRGCRHFDEGQWGHGLPHAKGTAQSIPRLSFTQLGGVVLDAGNLKEERGCGGGGGGEQGQGDIIGS